MTPPQKRSLVTALPGPRSSDLLARKERAVAPGIGVTVPAFAAEARGGVLVDVDGNSLIDLASGIAVTGVGNADPVVAAAIAEQAAKFTHTCAMVNPYESYVRVCEELNALLPGDFEKRSALLNTGAEAVENAVKIARCATGRQAVVVFDHAYHGRTNLTMALTAKNMPYKQGFGPFAPEVYRVPMSYPYRDGLSGQEAAQRAIETIEAQVGASNVAAVLIEPIQGEGGFVVPAEGFLPALSTWSTANGAVFIADEIQTGFCRTGDWFAVNREGVVPDLVTTAKGIAGGMPLAAVTGRAEIMSAVHPGGLGGTYGGNPLACAAALATIDRMRELDLLSAARRIEDQAGGRLRALAATTPSIGEVRGRGAMLAVEFVGADKTPDADLAKRVAANCHANGVIVLTCGTYGNVVRLLPPLVIGEDLLAEGLDVLESAIRDAE
ncbi:4-aminobutyrate aminotransferase/(S)-3-amino-2-methylpropionate transaminase [Crossiella equi]|uniref:(S)-3-amino-2-methylpropionate transaminase n=1 Tax=Crossiella equi TaxID=130796 RepID=A0ABS5AIH6_9PSEU|nr:4-aminobutyrate--2-oxoglutarate transaminase [Crossiella equi]MBP2476373.1 4-aminobutyrate aminotransferase/(S)-3-amino-2-methylpropionate transaminase [Crossiella equi]